VSINQSVISGIKPSGANIAKAVFLVYEGHGRGKAESSVTQSLKGLGNSLIMASPAYQPHAHITPAKLRHDVPQGPYFYSPQTGELYQAFRLYADHQLAFTEAALSDGAGGFKPLPGAVSVRQMRIQDLIHGLWLICYRVQ
jgi:hypothetical protein